MDNKICLYLCVMLLLMSGVLLSSLLKNSKSRPFVKRYIPLYILLILWQGLETCFFCVKSALALRLIYDLKLAVISFISVMLFFAFSAYFRVEKHFPSWLRSVLYVVPGVTALFAATTTFHPWVTESFEIKAMEPLINIVAERGGWFYLHSVYSLSLILAIGAIVAIRNYRLPKAFRSGTGLLITSLVTFVATFVIEMSFFGKTFVDVILIGAVMISVQFYIAIIQNGRSNYLEVESREIFDYLDVSVFVLGRDGSILDMNSQGRKWMDMMDVSADGLMFEELFESLRKNEEILFKPERGASRYHGDVYVLNTRLPLIYKMWQGDIRHPDSGVKVGSFVALGDITRNRLLIERLQSTAGVDPLTGLFNRYGYENLLKEYDSPECLPLSIIMGDVNGLKYVNDNYGHSEGDRLLFSVAAELQGCCDDKSFAARIGGDEFLVLSLACDEDSREQLMKSMADAVAQIDDFSIKPAIALGGATKTSENENINALLNLADQVMYRKKR